MHRLSAARLTVLGLAFAVMPALVGAEPPAELDAVTVEAQRHRAIAYHAVMAALERPRSSSYEDRHRLVCVQRLRPNSHLTRVECMTNEGWEYARARSLETAFGPIVPGPSYNPRQAPLMTLNTGELRRLGVQLAATGADHAARLVELAAEDAIARHGDEFGTSAAEVVRFARVFAAVRALPADADEMRAGQAVVAAGLSTEVYNALVERLERSERFRARVSVALGVLEQRSDPAGTSNP